MVLGTEPGRFRLTASKAYVLHASLLLKPQKTFYIAKEKKKGEKNEFAYAPRP